MRRTLTILFPTLLIIVILVILTVSVSASHKNAIIFPDSALETAVREAIDTADEEIYQSDLQGLTTLEAGGMGGGEFVSSLVGLEYCISLRELSLAQNSIPDLVPLAGLKNLKYLNIGDNPLNGDISSIANLTRLEYVAFDYCGLTDISVLSALENISSLYLFENNISDISPLVNNRGIGAGDYVDISLNNLDLTEGSDDIADIQTLIDRGVTVKY